MQRPSGRLAETYSLIYAFLTSREHPKAAKAVKKAAKASDITITKDLEPNGTSLETVVHEWTELSTRNAELEELKEHLMEEIKTLRKAQQKQKNDSSDEDSSSESDSASETSKSSDSSSSSSSSSSSDEQSKPLVKPKIQTSSKVNSKNTALSLAKPKNDRLISSITTNTQEENEVADTVLAPLTPQVEISHPIATKETSPAKSPPPDSSSSSDESEKPRKKRPASSLDDKTTKKRKLENGSAVETSHVSNRSSVKENGNGKKRNGVPFQRIKVEKIAIHDPRLMDNSFDARGASYSDYGVKASADLIVTKGAGFRKEKNKKKRGSYRGGEITMQSHSIKFE